MSEICCEDGSNRLNDVIKYDVSSDAWKSGILFYSQCSLTLRAVDAIGTPPPAQSGQVGIAFDA
jgi:hypothetical protein